eukprot:CAMPEP_0119546982 /NCGR_PEP_ID=MMETSP1352-20130426/1205_1 /TAXON_ID=265584 /ORGANISM="Stauroneis constricta, Strain CCMP1120" /LENGTH=1785 /DNA_ID=CAMNT_0007591771 /DNA_START=2006 /DNA_END=7363 /DNA_ORIENTATION=-
MAGSKGSSRSARRQTNSHRPQHRSHNGTHRNDPRKTAVAAASKEYKQQQPNVNINNINTNGQYLARDSGQGMPSPYPSFNSVQQAHQQEQEQWQAPVQPRLLHPPPHHHHPSMLSSEDGERTPLMSNLRSAEYDATANANATTSTASQSRNALPQHHVNHGHDRNHRDDAEPYAPREHYIPINGLPPNRLQEHTKSTARNKYRPSSSSSSSSSAASKNGSQTSGNNSPSPNSTSSEDEVSANSVSMLSSTSPTLSQTSLSPDSPQTVHSILSNGAFVANVNGFVRSRSPSPSDSTTADTTRSVGTSNGGGGSATRGGGGSAKNGYTNGHSNGYAANGHANAHQLKNKSSYQSADRTNTTINIYSGNGNSNGNGPPPSPVMLPSWARIYHSCFRCRCYCCCGDVCCCNDDDGDYDDNDKNHPHCQHPTTARISDRTKCIFALTLAFLAFLLCGETLVTHVMPRRDANNNENKLYATPSFQNSIDKLQWKDRHLFDEHGRYHIDNYDQQTPFYDELSSTIAAGVYGKPLYGWFVNRGQGMAGFGINCTGTGASSSAQVNNENNGNGHNDRWCSPIMTARTNADDSYATVPFQGFRTFLQFPSAAKAHPQSFGFQQQPSVGVSSSRVVEPFSPITSLPSNNDVDNENVSNNEEVMSPRRNMYIGKGKMSLHLQEIDPYHNIETNVTYFSMPEEDFGAMVRRVEITNTHHRHSTTFGILDGLVRMEPGRMDGKASSSSEGPAILKVSFPYTNTNVMAYYQEESAQEFKKHRDHQQQSHSSSTEKTSDGSKKSGGGHYCFSMMQISNDPNSQPSMLPILYDTEEVFQEDTAYSRPQGLERHSVSDLLANQIHSETGRSTVASAFAALDSITLKPGQTITITSMYGYAPEILDVPVYARRLMQEGFIEFKLSRANELWHQLDRSIQTQTSSMLWNTYVSNMYLQNSLSAGYPIVLGDSTILDDGTRTIDEDPRLKVYHIFSRDTEMTSLFFSQTRGNFATVMDKRRNDVIFNPRTGSFDIRSFLTFMQADASFPSTIQSVLFKVRNPHLCAVLAQHAVGQADGHRAQREALSNLLEQGPYRPGQLFDFLDRSNIGLMISRQEFIDNVIAASYIISVADHDGRPHEAHRADSSVSRSLANTKAWTSIIPMLRSYLSIFPDEEEWLLFEEQLPYYVTESSLSAPPGHGACSNEHILLHSLRNTNQTLVCTRCTDPNGKTQDVAKDDGRSSSLSSFEPSWKHDQYAKVFKSTAFEKLLILAAVKVASRDPLGLGVLTKPFSMTDCGSVNEASFDNTHSEDGGHLLSDVASVFELKVLLQYLRNVLSKYPKTVTIPIELSELIADIGDALTAESPLRDGDGDDDDDVPVATSMEFTVPRIHVVQWNLLSAALSKYSRRTQVEFRGWTIPVHPETIVDALNGWLDHIEQARATVMKMMQASHAGTGVDGTMAFNDLTPTYITYKIEEWATVTESSHSSSIVSPKTIGFQTQPTFVDGPVAEMESETSSRAKTIYGKLRDSALYDRAMSTFRRCSNANNDDDSNDDDSNESCWIHPPGFMPGNPFANDLQFVDTEAVSSVAFNNKISLELLRNGMYDAFFESLMSGGAPPFVDPALYGRPSVDVVAQVATSNALNPNLVGRGMLSSSPDAGTAEFLSLWIQMMIGPKLFFIADNRNDRGRHLEMQLRPTIPYWMFTQGDCPDGNASARTNRMGHARHARPSEIDECIPHVTFSLFSSIQVNYYNQRGHDLRDAIPNRYRVEFRDGTTFDTTTSTIPNDAAEKIRRIVFTERIDVYFS